MFRYLFELVGLLLFFAAVRSVISWVLRLLAVTFQSPQAAQQSAQSSVLHSAGELQKDPVCGTFVPVASSLKRMVSGHPVYFCSPECRDRY